MPPLLGAERFDRTCTPACVRWDSSTACRLCRLEPENRSHLIYPGPSSSRSCFFMESSQLYASTLTHYSTEPLTTGPDYDPLLLLLALAGDVHPNPGPSRYPCSVCFKNITSQGTSYLCTICSHWVHSRCSGLRNAADYHKANGWVCTACMAYNVKVAAI